MQVKIDFRHLRYFIAIAEEESFVGASLKLNIAQPALSRQIKALEDDLRVDLLIRNSKGVALTNAGAIFLAEAKKIIDNLDTMILKTRRSAEESLSQNIVGACNDAISMKEISQHMNAFTQNRTNVEYRLLMRSKSEALRMVTDGTIDFYLGPETKNVNETLEAQDFLEEEGVIVHPTTSPDKNHELRWIIVPDLFEDHEKVLEKEFGPRTTFKGIPLIADDWACALSLVASGQGISVVPKSWAALNFDQVAVKPTERISHRFKYQIYFSNINESADFGALTRWLKKSQVTKAEAQTLDPRSRSLI